MSGLIDLLFFGLIVWIVLRAAGRATGGGAEPDERAGGSTSGPPVRGPREREHHRPGRRPEAQIGRPRTGEVGLRSRLMEELRRWEEEQRARQQASLEARIPPPTRRPATPRPPARRPTPRAPARSPVEAAPEPAAVAVRGVEERSSRLPGARLLEDTRAEVSHRVAPPVRGTPGERPVAAEDVPVPVAGRRRSGASLPDFSRLSRLQRAVLWTEILGPPAGLRNR